MARRGFWAAKPLKTQDEADSDAAVGGRPPAVPLLVVPPGVPQEQETVTVDLSSVEQRVGVRLHQAVWADVLLHAGSAGERGDNSKQTRGVVLIIY